MKIGLYIAFICLVMFPAYAQNAGSQESHVSGETTTTLVQDYADRVNGLLRDVHANLQTISERVEAGALTRQQGQRLKLAATPDRALGNAFSDVRQQDSIGCKCARPMHTRVWSFE